MTSKVNLPAMAIIGASFSQLPNIFKGVFVYFWPFLLFLFLKDYFVISSKTGGLENTSIITTILTIFIILCISAVQVCWYQKVITKQDFKYSFDKRSFVTIGYSFLYTLFISAAAIGFTIGFAFLSEESYISSGFGMTISGIGILISISLAFRGILAFPAIAVNNSNTRLKRSWELTKGYHFNLFFMMMGFTILISIPSAFATVIITMFGVSSTFGFLLIMFFLNIIFLMSILIMTEMIGRLFVFFHVPEKIKDYL